MAFAFTSSNAVLEWQKLEEGLHFVEFIPSPAPQIGNGKISILKIDPHKFEFDLPSAKNPGETTLTASNWAKKKNLVAVVNTGMFLNDYKTNKGYMEHFGNKNNPQLNSDNTIAAFNPKSKDVPAFQLIDRKCQNWDLLKKKYNSFAQSIRMVDCQQKNRWSLQPKMWSMVILGEDKEGNALFIFTRSPHKVHNFINILLGSSIELKKAMYLEGGPEASLHINHPKKRLTLFGSYETGFYENDGNDREWPIPNVIGIRRK